MDARRHQETGLRILAGILVLTGVTMMLLAVRMMISQQQTVSISGLVVVVAWGFTPAIAGWLVWKLATALEWLADIKRKLDA
jgi:hypothetical protein